MVKIEKLPVEPLALGEAPHWCRETQSLIFVDINTGKVVRFEPSSNSATVTDLGLKPVSFIIPVKGTDNDYVIGNGLQVKKITSDLKGLKNEQAHVIASAYLGDLGERLNDGKCDSRGRLWTGSMGRFLEDKQQFEPEKGALYSLGDGQGLIQKLNRIGLSNGLTWSIDNTRFYYIDSLTNQVSGFKFDLDTGSIEDRETVFDLEENNIAGSPDGMTIDAEGKLWVAVFRGACVLRIDPESRKLLQRVDLPSYQITSLAFGGKNLDELYVTSANLNIPEEILQKFPDAGCTFRLTELGTKGVPMASFKP